MATSLIIILQVNFEILNGKMSVIGSKIGRERVGDSIRTYMFQKKSSYGYFLLRNAWNSRENEEITVVNQQNSAFASANTLQTRTWKFFWFWGIHKTQKRRVIQFYHRTKFHFSKLIISCFSGTNRYRNFSGTDPSAPLQNLCPSCYHRRQWSLPSRRVNPLRFGRASSGMF